MCLLRLRNQQLDGAGCLRKTHQSKFTLCFLRGTVPHYPTSRPESSRPLISPSEPAGNDGLDNEHGDLIVRAGQPIVDPKTERAFVPRMHLGAGEFGHVYKVMSQGKSFAMKISRNDAGAREQFQAEVDILEVLSNPQIQEHFSNYCFDTIIKFECAFNYHGHICVVTEALGPSLMKIIQERKYSGVGLDLVQSVLRDVLTALSAMAQLQIIHTDVKPENVLQKNIMSQNVKLIDMGNARLVDEEFNGYAQSRFYRAPEVILRLPIAPASDMWSVGCMAAELMLGLPLLPGQDEVHQFWLITQMFGPIPDYMIKASPVARPLSSPMAAWSKARTHPPSMPPPPPSSTPPRPSPASPTIATFSPLRPSAASCT